MLNRMWLFCLTRKTKLDVKRCQMINDLNVSFCPVGIARLTNLCHSLAGFFSMHNAAGVTCPMTFLLAWRPPPTVLNVTLWKGRDRCNSPLLLSPSLHFCVLFLVNALLDFYGRPTEDIKRVISNTMEMDTGNNPSGHNRMTAIVRNVRNGKNNIYWEIGFDTLTRV